MLQSETVEVSLWSLGHDGEIIQTSLKNWTFSLLPLGEISCYKDEIETELEKTRPKLRGIYAAYAKEIGL